MRVQTVVRNIVTGTAFAAMASGLGGSAAFANELTGFAMMLPTLLPRARRRASSPAREQAGTRCPC